MTIILVINFNIFFENARFQDLSSRMSHNHVNVFSLSGVGQMVMGLLQEIKSLS